MQTLPGLYREHLNLWPSINNKLINNKLILNTDCRCMLHKPNTLALSLFLSFFFTQLYAQSQNAVSITVSEGTNMAIAVSPDGKTLALDIQGTIHTVPVTGGAAKPLTDGMGDERQPAWSPDGNKIAFQSFRDGTYHIWAINRDGSDLQQLTFGIYDEREPQWSADGSNILFSSDRAGNYDIWEMSLQNGALKQLTHDPADDYCPAWSPDGRNLSFVSNRKEGGLYIADASGKERLAVPFKGAAFASPSWSPDGKQIAFNSLAGASSQLILLSVSDDKPTAISGATEDVFPFRCAWLSNTSILYTADGKIRQKTPGKKEVATIPFKVNFVLHPPAYVRKQHDFDSDSLHTALGIFGPAVSPDGNDIAFSALGNLWLLSKGTEKPRQLTDDAAVDIDAAFSPDGKKLAFVSDRQGGPMALWVRDLQTGTDKRLTDVQKDVMYPCWSPDGTRIALLLNEAANVWGLSTLYVLQISSGELTPVHAPLFVPGKPSWSPDGKTLVLSALEPSSARFREGTSRFLLVSLDGKPDKFISPVPGRTLATREKNGPAWSPDGSKMAYIQDGVLWVVPVSSSGEIRGYPKRLTNELSDVPTWTGDSKALVYTATDRLKKVYLADGSIESIPIDLRWKMQQPAGELVIHAGRLFDGRSSSYRKNVDVVINGNRIVRVEPHQANRTNVIDASDKTIIPGLFEMHTHQYAGTGEVQGRNWLSYGITSVRETGADPYDALERKEAWASGVRPGPREFFAGDLLDGERVYYGMANSISSGAHLDLELDRAAKLDYDLIKTYVRFPDMMQKRVTAFAHAHGIPVSSHEIYPAALYGVDCVEHIKATSRRGYSPKQTSLNFCYEDVIQIVAKSGMNMTPTISLFGGFYLKAESDSSILRNKQLNALYPQRFVTAVGEMVKQRLSGAFSIRETYGTTNKMIRKLVNAGAHITPGTDSPFIPYGLSLHVELQSFASAGLSPFEVLRSATLWSAQAAGVEKDLGTIEAGKLADFVVVDGDPLSNVQDAWNVQIVFKNGIRYNISTLLKTN